MLNALQRESSALRPKIHVPRKLLPMGLLARLVSLVCLFALELIVLSVWLDTSALGGQVGLTATVADFGPYILQSLIVFATVLVALGYAKAKSTFLVISGWLEEV